MAPMIATTRPATKPIAASPSVTHEVAQISSRLAAAFGDREEVVPDVDRTLGDERRDLEDPERCPPRCAHDGDQGQGEREQAPAEGRSTPRVRRRGGRRGCRSAAGGAICCSSVRGGHGGHADFPFDHGAMPRAMRPTSAKPSERDSAAGQGAAPRPAARWSSAARGSSRCPRRPRSCRRTHRARRRGRRRARRSAGR